MEGRGRGMIYSSWHFPIRTKENHVISYSFVPDKIRTRCLPSTNQNLNRVNQLCWCIKVRTLLQNSKHLNIDIHVSIACQ
jgi:hypothetical protein